MTSIVSLNVHDTKAITTKKTTWINNGIKTTQCIEVVVRDTEGNKTTLNIFINTKLDVKIKTLKDEVIEGV